MSELKKITKPEFLAYEDELGRFHLYEKYRKLDGRIDYQYQGFLINKEALEQRLNWYLSRPYWKTIQYCPNKTIRDRGNDIQCQSWLFTPNQEVLNFWVSLENLSDDQWKTIKDVIRDFHDKHESEWLKTTPVWEFVESIPLKESYSEND